MKKLLVKRILCFLSAAALILTAGCGKQNTGGNGAVDGSLDGSPGESQLGSEENQDTAMGRYAEEELDLTKELEIVSGMRKMPDGRLVITDNSFGIMESKDNGATWEKAENSWLDGMMDHAYFMDVQIAPDGTLAVIYDDYGEAAGEEDGEAESEEGGNTEADSPKIENNGADSSEAEVAETESGETKGAEPKEAGANEAETNDTERKETEAKGAEPKEAGTNKAEPKEEEEDGIGTDEEKPDEGESESGEEVSAFDLDPVCELIKPDGTVVPVTLSLAEGEEYPSNIWISDSGRIFVTTLGNNIYEVNEDGSSELFLATEGMPRFLQFCGNILIADGYDFSAPLFYDLEKREIVEEGELSAFIEDNYGDRGFNGGSWYDLYIFPGEEGEIYLAGEKGLHRYTAGEGGIEQLVDGKLSRLGSPLYPLKSMAALESGEFLSVSRSGKLVRFTYDPDMPSVPSESLKVYSLEDSYSIRTAISLYQISHPEVYVEYEIGMAEGEAAVRDDALKKLNTQIMSGEGPDLLMLDGLPMDSYIEKGLLLDLTDFMEHVNKEEALYENLYQAMAKDGKTYVVPAHIYLPVVLGREKYVSKMDDLESMAEQICRIREDNPGKDIIYISNEKAMMKAFAPVAAPVWKSGSGEINEDAIADFLAQMKVIYEAQMDGLNEKSLENLRQMEEYWAGEYGEDWMYSITQYGSSELYIVGDYQQLSVGVTTYPYGYYELVSVSKAKGFEDVVFSPMKGLCEKVYVPATILGINAASGKIDRAKDFLREFLGKETQTALGGYVINKEALEESFKPEEDYVGENGEYGMIAIIDEDGLETSLNIYLPTEEEMDLFRGWMESADTPYIADMVLEKTVFEEGEKYIQGEQSIEETLDGIRQQLAIYLSE